MPRRILLLPLAVPLLVACDRPAGAAFSPAEAAFTGPRVGVDFASDPPPAAALEFLAGHPETTCVEVTDHA